MQAAERRGMDDAVAVDLKRGAVIIGARPLKAFEVEDGVKVIRC